MSIWTKTSSGWVEIGGGGGSDGLEGLGDWAVITEVSGSPKRYAYNDGGMDWVAFEWTADGELTTQAGGLVDALVCSGGVQCIASSYQGSAGGIVTGLQSLAKGPATVVVGTQGTANDVASNNHYFRLASRSSLGSIFAQVSHRGAAGWPWEQTGNTEGYKSSITGSEKHYSGVVNGTPSATQHGFGQTAGGSPGSDGVVICRVPAAQAAGVDPGSWVTRIDYYAEVTDGIVTDLYQERFYGDDTVRTENGRYASPEQPDDLIPCDPTVAEGWTYADGEFTPPPPDPSWREQAIAALKQQLKDLQKDT